MSKHKFTDAERYAVFTVHGERCYLCHKPLSLQEMEVDHLIPESLVDDAARLVAVLLSLGRVSDFTINSFANWMPACGPCNRQKREAVFDPSPIIQLRLQRAADRAGEAQRLAEEVISERKLSNAVNAVLRAGEKGHLPAAVIESLRPLIVYHMEHRNQELIAQPIRLTSDVAMAMEIQFAGGPRHGEIAASGNPGLEVDSARWLILGIAPFIKRVEQGGPKPKSFLTWKQPCKEMVELAKAKDWTEEERRARMKHHIYEVHDYEWTDYGIRLKAEYQGID